MKTTLQTGKPKSAPEPEPAEQKPPEVLPIAAELQKMPYEPLLPIEKKLVLWSVLLGLFLLGALAWVNQVLFRG